MRNNQSTERGKKKKMRQLARALARSLKLSLCQNKYAMIGTRSVIWTPLWIFLGQMSYWHGSWCIFHVLNRLIDFQTRRNKQHGWILWKFYFNTWRDLADSSPIKVYFYVWFLLEQRCVSYDVCRKLTSTCMLPDVKLLFTSFYQFMVPSTLDILMNINCSWDFLQSI